MIKLILVLIYLYGGEVHVEKSYYETLEQCEKAGKAKVAQQVKDEKFEEGYFAACIETKVREA